MVPVQWVMRKTHDFNGVLVTGLVSPTARVTVTATVSGWSLQGAPVAVHSEQRRHGDCNKTWTQIEIFVIVRAARLNQTRRRTQWLTRLTGPRI